jgi:hypothetical protein
MGRKKRSKQSYRPVISSVDSKETGSTVDRCGDKAVPTAKEQRQSCATLNALYLSGQRNRHLPAVIVDLYDEAAQ